MEKEERKAGPLQEVKPGVLIYSTNLAREDRPATERRVLYGFTRTTCSCALCTAPCKHVPGGLDPADLEFLCPPGLDLFSWAEEHLRALCHKPYPILVPARQANGHCHWLFQERCMVHQNSPFGCAFFDAHMPAEEVDCRYGATVKARLEDKSKNGLYFRLWQYLRDRGLVGSPGNKQDLEDEIRRIQNG